MSIKIGDKVQFKFTNDDQEYREQHFKLSNPNTIFDVLNIDDGFIHINYEGSGRKTTVGTDARRFSHLIGNSDKYFILKMSFPPEFVAEGNLEFAMEKIKQFSIDNPETVYYLAKAVMKSYSVKPEQIREYL